MREKYFVRRTVTEEVEISGIPPRKRSGLACLLDG
jgi:hypothetical protein